MINEIFIKLFLTSYFLFYYGILFVLNSFLVFKRTGKNPYVIGQSKGVISYTEKSIKIVGIIIPIVLLAYIFSQRVYLWLIPIQYLENIYFKLAGITIMILGLILCLIAQHYMRSSWKIGIGLNAEVKLVDDGIFSYSRNPFFLGTILSFLGFFLVLPNIITFAFGFVYYFLIQIQVRLEEENLGITLGNTYHDYCACVRRWI